MEEIYRIADVSFSTADAEFPKMLFDDSGTLTLEFRDWQNQAVRLKFKEVLGFKWDEGEMHSAERNDVTYEVVNSVWLRNLKEDNISRTEHRHYKLCFNASGTFDVLFSDLEVSVGP
jgi:hypothetical protein